MKIGELQIQRNLYPVKPQAVAIPDNPPEKVSNGQNGLKPRFEKILQDKIWEKTEIRFSAHALRRLDEQQISLSPDNLDRLKNGVENIEEKGGRSSLILMDDTAYVISVNNRTVVTTLNTEATKNNVFTNIDSVAIV